MCLSPNLRCAKSPALLLALWLASSALSHAATLPRLELVGADLSTTSTSQLPLASGKWLLIYVRPRHSASDELLRRVSAGTYAGVPERTVVVVAGVPPDRLRTFAANYPELAGALWYADPLKKVGPILKLNGSPVIVGVDHQEITWSVNGLPRSDRWTQSMFTTWVKRGR